MMRKPSRVRGTRGALLRVERPDRGHGRSRHHRRRGPEPSVAPIARPEAFPGLGLALGALVVAFVAFAGCDGSSNDGGLGSRADRWPPGADSQGFPVGSRLYSRYLRLTPSSVVARVAVNGRPALVLRVGPYPDGGIHGGHYAIVWNGVGAGYVLSFHYHRGDPASEGVDRPRPPRRRDIRALTRAAGSMTAVRSDRPSQGPPLVDSGSLGGKVRRACGELARSERVLVVCPTWLPSRGPAPERYQGFSLSQRDFERGRCEYLTQMGYSAAALSATVPFHILFGGRCGEFRLESAQASPDVRRNSRLQARSRGATTSVSPR